MGDSWGNLYKSGQQVHTMQWRTDPPPTEPSLLAVGNRRSYGDVCVNEGGSVIETTALSRFINFDPQKGIIRCESGATLWDVALLTVPHGWFLPVTPGTSFVTVGGAVANDVHGKNHHVSGSFGCYVQRFELKRSNGEILECSADTNPGYFSATIGGCGLTGLITWVEFSLKKIHSPHLQVESIPYASYRDFLELSQQSEQSHEYCVSWIDCLASGDSLGRGVFFRANHEQETADLNDALHRGVINVPGIVGKGFPLVNNLSLRLFNLLYTRAHAQQKVEKQSFSKYFYPLDSLLNWNRIYGRRGFYQFQCVVPFDQSDAIPQILATISKAGQGSFLSVLKTMGNLPSPGLMSFSRPGVTLALDFPNRGKRTTELLNLLERIVVESHGAIYPAKDAVMSASSFRQFYPAIEEFSQYIDPAFSSSFWRRVS